MSGSSRWISDTHTKKWRIRGIPEMKIPSFLWYFLHFFFFVHSIVMYMWKHERIHIQQSTAVQDTCPCDMCINQSSIYISIMYWFNAWRRAHRISVSAHDTHNAHRYIFYVFFFFLFFFVLINIRQSDGPTHPHTLCRPTFFFSLFFWVHSCLGWHYIFHDARKWMPKNKKNEKIWLDKVTKANIDRQGNNNNNKMVPQLSRSERSRHRITCSHIPRHNLLFCKM